MALKGDVQGDRAQGVPRSEELCPAAAARRGGGIRPKVPGSSCCGEVRRAEPEGQGL